jgi:beta-lactam-binding protein with PASTA domain
VTVAGIVALASLGWGCDKTPSYTTVPSNAGVGLDLAMHRLRDAGLRVSIPSFPRNPCGVGIEGYHVLGQSPRAPARVERGSTVVMRVFPSGIPTSISDSRPHPKFAVVPDLEGVSYPAAMSRLDGISPCIDRVAALTPSASTDGFGAYVVATQDLAPGTRVPYDGVATHVGFRPSVLHLTLTLG